jgi:glycerophosphoryl diester phosphodiesterase
MNWKNVALASLLIGSFPGNISLRAQPASPPPLIRAHAHNDYEHTHPLFDALEQGYCSVEADIHLVDGKLLVAHDAKDVDPQKTLESLYLDPLRNRIKQNNGHLYPNGPECVLLIDFKTDPKSTYPALRKVLEQYADILTVFRNGKKETNAITAILTGGYSRDLLAKDTVRYAAGDGKLMDLTNNPPANLVPWISENWSEDFKWRAKGPMPEAERAKLKEIVAKAHAQGRKVRFWGSPDKPAFWKELLDDNVDLINTDNLPGYAKFYWEWQAGRK